MDNIHIPKVENVKLLNKFSPKQSPLGTLYLTTTHLIFVSVFPDDKKELWILHMQINTVEKPLLTTSGTQLKILCSNFQTATFIIQKDREAHEVYTSLIALSKPAAISDLYAFTYRPKTKMQPITGWTFHNLEAEFARQGVPNEAWTACSLNSDYSLCPTYPSVFYVPTTASRGVIEGSARFRSRGRLPVLTYLHKNRAAMIRCSQPMVGVGNNRSTADEKYVEALRMANPHSQFIYVIDTRPAVNALANKAGGKGYENEKNYENIRFLFKGIENIHVMRKSLKAMFTAVTGNVVDGFLSELGNSGWLKHVRAVIDTSIAIVECILEDKSVIVHCSDGWDRTSQTCALAQLMLDKHYRTIQGYQMLIEKDWLAFGHKFTDRCGHIQGHADDVSPIFTQFLDSTWQLMEIYPNAFEFNENYLITIHEHVYSCQYGTFLGESEKQRMELGIREKTYSLWGALVDNISEFKNPLYNPNHSPEVLRPKLQPQNIQFWRGLYCRYEEGALPRESVVTLLTVTAAQTSSLEDHGRQISQRITSVTKMIGGHKAAGAVMKMLPNSISPNKSAGPSRGGATAAPVANPSNDDLERKFTDLRTSIVEKCQSSKT